jgi:hypothetical protein
MPLWGKSKGTVADKPKYLSTDTNADVEVRKDLCVGAQPADVGTTAGGTRVPVAAPGAGLIGDAGWTQPAGGNGNPNAKREVLVCLKSMTA